MEKRGTKQKRGLECSRIVPQDNNYVFLVTTKFFGMWWPGTESNRRRQPFQGCALPAELPGRGISTLPNLQTCCSDSSASPVARSTSACSEFPCASIVTIAAKFFTFKCHIASGI